MKIRKLDIKNTNSLLFTPPYIFIKKGLFYSCFLYNDRGGVNYVNYVNKTN